MDRIQLGNLNPQDVIHPEDKRTLDKLKKISGFETLLKKTVVAYQEAVSDVECTGSNFEINAKSSPELYGRLLEDCAILGCKQIPNLSTQWAYFVSSYSVGGKNNNRIVLSSGSIDLLEPKELDFLIGHEIGHIISGHEPYHMLLNLIYSPVINSVDTLNIASLIKLPLLQWYRTSHYSADRFGLLCCQDINIALRTMIKMSGYPKKYYSNINIDSFITQAKIFEEENRGAMTKIIEQLSIRAASMPWLAYRAKLLLDWYQSGDYATITNGYACC